MTTHDCLGISCTCLLFMSSLTLTIHSTASKPLNHIILFPITSPSPCQTCLFHIYSISKSTEEDASSYTETHLTNFSWTSSIAFQITISSFKQYCNLIYSLFEQLLNILCVYREDTNAWIVFEI